VLHIYIVKCVDILGDHISNLVMQRDSLVSETTENHSADSLRTLGVKKTFNMNDSTPNSDKNTAQSPLKRARIGKRVLKEQNKIMSEDLEAEEDSTPRSKPRKGSGTAGNSARGKGSQSSFSGVATEALLRLPVDRDASDSVKAALLSLMGLY